MAVSREPRETATLFGDNNMKPKLKDYKELRKMLAEEIRVTRKLEKRFGASDSDVVDLNVHIVEGYVMLHQMEDALKSRIKTKRRMTPEEAIDNLVTDGCDRNELLRLVNNVRKSM